MGRTLLPLSFAHFIVLDELIGADLYSAEHDAATLDIISRVCAQRMPYLAVNGMDEDERARYAMSLMQFKAEEQMPVWQAYFDLCFHARPRVGSYEGGAAEDYRAPWPLIVTTFILRHTPAHSHEALWYDMPVSQALWIYEGVREQICGRSFLCLTDEPEPELSAEEKMQEERHHARARKILARCMAERVKIGKAGDRKERAKRLKELGEEQQRLLHLSAAEKLDDELQEIAG